MAMQAQKGCGPFDEWLVQLGSYRDFHRSGMLRRYIHNSGSALNQQYLLCRIDFLELYFNNLPAACRNVLAHVGSFDRQLTVAAIDQHA
jgi:hypothetical protein